MVELTETLGDHGPFHIFRPNRDVRFAKDKTPYKDHMGAYSESEGGAGYYIHLGASGILTGCGYYDMAADQLERFRAAVDASATGEDRSEVRRGREAGLAPRRDERAEDRATGLPEGPPAHRTAAPQGPDRHPGVAAGEVDAHQAGRHAHPRRLVGR
jgi:uncharacterized protein (DUF2461 family)